MDLESARRGVFTYYPIGGTTPWGSCRSKAAGDRPAIDDYSSGGELLCSTLIHLFTSHNFIENVDN